MSTYFPIFASLVAWWDLRKCRKVMRGWAGFGRDFFFEEKSNGMCIKCNKYEFNIRLLFINLSIILLQLSPSLICCCVSYRYET